MSQEGKPWIGFAIKKAKGKSTILVKDCAEKGPAFAAGLQDGDEIVTIDGKAMPDMPTFRGVVCRFKQGQRVKIGITRNNQNKDLELTVGVKRRENIPNVPPMRSVEDLQNILADRRKLKTISEAAFAVADDDLSGLVTREEFSSAMRNWLPASLCLNMSAMDLHNAFDSVDIDKSGFLAGSEFQPVVEGLIRTLIRQHGDNSTSALPTTVPRDTAPKKETNPQLRPWLGFVVSKTKGKPTLYIRDVVDNGPAAKAGVCDRDEIVTFNNAPVSDMLNFRKAVLQLKVGQQVRMEIARDNNGKDNAIKKEVTVSVEGRHKEVVPDPPRLETVADAEAILKDRKKLVKASDHVFTMADTNMSGMLSYSEFQAVIRAWLPNQLNDKINDSDLRLAFNGADSDNSGFLSKSEFVPVVERMLKILVEHGKGSFVPPAPPVTPQNNPQPPNFQQQQNTSVPEERKCKCCIIS